MKRVETEALTLRTYNLDDASRIVVCLTRDHGVIRGVANGARRLKSQFGAGFEPFTLVNLTYYEKETRELVTLRSVEIVRSYFQFAGDPNISDALGRFSNLLLEFAAPAEPNQNLFRLVEVSLNSLVDASEQAGSVVFYFEFWLLRLMGFMPEWSECGACGQSFSEGTAWLETELLVTCSNCKSGRGLAITPKVLQQFRSARRLPPEAFLAQRASVPTASLKNAFEVTNYLISSVLAPKTLRQFGGIVDGTTRKQGLAANGSSTPPFAKI